MTIVKFFKRFISSNNEKVNSGVVLVSVGTFLGLIAFSYYAFYLRKDIGSNLVYLLLGILGGGGAVGGLASKFGLNTKRIGRVGEVKED